MHKSLRIKKNKKKSKTLFACDRIRLLTSSKYLQIFFFSCVFLCMQKVKQKKLIKLSNSGFGLTLKYLVHFFRLTKEHSTGQAYFTPCSLHDSVPRWNSILSA